VTITGTGFSGATVVDFGTTPATDIVVVNNGTITAVSPPGAGVADVSVTTPAGTSATTPTDQFTYIAAPAMVMSVSRFGFHMHPTSLVIQFDGALDAASAQNVRGYTIIGPGGRKVAIASAIYDANTRSVTLSPASRLNVHYAYHLIVHGTGSDAIKDEVGDAIDGANDGTAGTDYQTKITAADLVILGNHPRVKKSLAAILAKEKRALAKHRLS
jgi:IPT/TIG domain